MGNLILTWILSAVLLLVTAGVVPGFRIRSFGSALIAALVLGLLNAFVRPLFAFLAFPITFLTLGLFTFFVNAAILRLGAGLLKGFDIDGWIPALVGAVLLALLQALLFNI